MATEHPPPALVPVSVCLSPDQRSLRLDFGRDRAPGAGQLADAMIDVGEGGRLLSIEIVPLAGDEPVVIDIDPPAGALSRTASVTVTIERDEDGALAAVVLPRRGAGYEITYPSGNQ